ncbi:MAG TPA: hypothetical protein VFK12_10555 [Gammaproteobacteria bacterium]|jgi:hypothetical protein|nr:hypothetical protein [Gammaproteobacteria bacterium]
MKKLIVIISCLLALGLAACSSGNDSKQGKDASNPPPKKSVFDPYIQDVNKAKQVQGKLDAAQQKNNAQLQQAESANTVNQPDSAQPPTK